MGMYDPPKPPPARDTMCKGCGKWTHQLTPGGKDIVFCDAGCKARYERNKR